MKTIKIQLIEHIKKFTTVFASILVTIMAKTMASFFYSNQVRKPTALRREVVQNKFNTNEMSLELNVIIVSNKTAIQISRLFAFLTIWCSNLCKCKRTVCQNIRIKSAHF